MFLYRLALALGKTVTELQSIPSEELTTWQAYYSLEPFGHWRTDLNAAYICSVLASCHGDKQSHPQKYMPDFDPLPWQEKLKRQLLAKAKPI